MDWKLQMKILAQCFMNYCISSWKLKKCRKKPFLFLCIAKSRTGENYSDPPILAIVYSSASKVASVKQYHILGKKSVVQSNLIYPDYNNLKSWCLFKRQRNKPTYIIYIYIYIHTNVNDDVFVKGMC